MVEDLGDLCEGSDVGVVEGVDAPVDVVAGPVSHKAAAHGVLNAGGPGQVGGAALAEQVGGDAEGQMIAGETLGDRSFVEGVAVGVLAGAVGRLEAGDEAGGGVDLSGVGVGVESVDGNPEEVHELGWYDEDTGTGGGFGGLLVGDGHDLAVVVADGEGPAALALDGEQPGAADVDDVSDGDAEGFGDAQAHDPLQPEGELVNRVEVGGEPGALSKGERAGLSASVRAATVGLVGNRSVEAFGGVEPGWEEAVGSGEGENPAQHS